VGKPDMEMEDIFKGLLGKRYLNNLCKSSYSFPFCTSSWFFYMLIFVQVVKVLPTLVVSSVTPYSRSSIGILAQSQCQLKEQMFISA